MRIRITAFLLLVTTAVLAAERDAAFVVIVHEGGPARLDRQFIAQAFLKKVHEWPDGQTIRPVDLPPASSVRASFDESLLGRGVVAVKIYWNQLIFTGRDLPPPELDGDQVLDYVRRNPGAIGYLPAGTATDGVTVVELE